jgi:hypothetical protein
MSPFRRNDACRRGAAVAHAVEARLSGRRWVGESADWRPVDCRDTAAPSLAEVAMTMPRRFVPAAIPGGDFGRPSAAEAV